MNVHVPLGDEIPWHVATVTVWRTGKALTVTVDRIKESVEIAMDEDGNPTRLSAWEEVDALKRVRDGEDETGR
jgi:hypothetical protein